MSDSAPIASPANSAVESRGHVLVTKSQMIGYQYGIGLDVNGINPATYSGTFDNPIFNPGIGYYDGTWFFTYIPFAQKTKNPLAYIVPNFTGEPKPGAAPGKTDPTTGLFYDITVNFPLLYTFGKNWTFVSIADFSASIGQDVTAGNPFDLSLPGATTGQGLFAVRKIAPPTSDDVLTLKILTPILSNIFSITSNIEVFASWTYQYSYDVSSTGGSNGPQFVPEGFFTSVTTTAAQTNQTAGINQIIGAQSGKIIDLASLSPAVAANFDTSVAFASKESFYPNSIVLPLLITPPPFPVIPPSTEFGSTSTYTPKRMWLTTFTQAINNGGEFLQFVGGHQAGG